MIPGNLISALFNLNSLVVLPPAVVTSSSVTTRTRLLFKTNGVEAAGNNIFLDSSTNNLAISRLGNTAQGSFSPFSPSGWGCEFNGSSGLAVPVSGSPAATIGTGDFTVEVWFNLPSAGYVFSFGTYRSENCIFADATGGVFRFRLFAAGSTTDGSNPSAPIVYNTWNHIALVRQRGVCTSYINGVNIGSIVNTASYSTTSGIILGGASAVGSFTNGYPAIGILSNFRLTAAAVYVSNFTPSTSPLTAITDTRLLALQDNRFKDNSASNLTFTISGTPKIIPVSPFEPSVPYSAAVHGGSLYFDGVGDWLQVINTPLLNLTSDFTVEFWAYLDNSSTFQIPVGANANGDMMIAVGYPANSISIGQHNVAWNSAFTGHNIPSKVWTHIALARTNAVLKCFINGIQLGDSISNAVQYASSGVRIGSNDSGYFVAGYISNLRIVKGLAVYTANFSPPTAPLTAIAGTSLLLRGVNAGIYDATARRNVEAIGSAQTSVSIKKYQASIYLPNSSSYLSVADTSSQQPYSLMGDFTVEMWIKAVSTQAYTTLISSDNGNFTAGSWTLLFDSAGQLMLYAAGIGGSGLVVGSGSTIVNNNRWNHVVVQRAGAAFTIFINGIAVGSATSPFTQGLNPTNILIGAQLGHSRNLVGYIEDARISAYAVYSVNFTPPILKVVGIYGADDEHFNNNSLVIQAAAENNGTNNTFSDQSPNALAITAQGPVGQGNFSPYGGAFSGKFSETDYVSLPASSAYGLGTGDFTLECYIFRNTKSSNTLLEFRTGATASALVVRVTQSNFISVYDGPANAERFSSSLVPLQQWSHVAVVRKAGILSFFVDGALDPTTYSIVSNLGTSCPCFIGFNQTAGHGHNGLISNVRITKSALYNGSFTSDLANLTSLANTTLLCLQDNRFKDNSVSNAVVTPVGATIVRTNQLPRSVAYDRVTEGSSIYLNGNSSYLTVPHSAATTFNNADFTVEMWVYPVTFSGYRTLFTKNAADGTYYGFNLQLQDNVPKLWASSGGGTWNIADALGSIAIRIGEWAHIAVTRTASSYSIWVNGVLSGTRNSTVNYLDNGSPLGIGSYSGSAYRVFNGYVSDLRLVKGVALYNAPFTPPSSTAVAISGTALLLKGGDAKVSDATGRNNITMIGAAKISTNIFKFTSSIYFNGVTDSLLIGKDAAIFGTGDFTIDFWLRPIAFAEANRILMTGEVSNAFSSTINVEGNISHGRSLMAISGYTTNAAVFGQWNHIVIRRANGTIEIFINGVRGLSAANSVDYVQSDVRVGAESGGNSGGYVNGYLEDFRMTRGKLRYTVEPKAAL